MEGFSDTLRMQAEAKREEFVALQADKLRIERQLEALEKYIDHLNPLLVAEGLDPVAMKGPVGLSGFTPGNRSSAMPDRKPEYDGRPLSETVVKLLTEAGGPLHANALIEAVYDIKTKADHKHAKQSLVGALGGMHKKGQLERVGPNTYQLPSGALNGQRPLGEGVLVGQ